MADSTAKRWQLLIQRVRSAWTCRHVAVSGVRRPRPRLETLEDRRLLSATPLGVMPDVPEEVGKIALVEDTNTTESEVAITYLAEGIEVVGEEPVIEKEILAECEVYVDEVPQESELIDPIRTFFAGPGDVGNVEGMEKGESEYVDFSTEVMVGEEYPTQIFFCGFLSPGASEEVFDTEGDGFEPLTEEVTTFGDESIVTDPGDETVWFPQMGSDDAEYLICYSFFSPPEGAVTDEVAAPVETWEAAGFPEGEEPTFQTLAIAFVADGSEVEGDSSLFETTALPPTVPDIEMPPATPTAGPEISPTADEDTRSLAIAFEGGDEGASGVGSETSSEFQPSEDEVPQLESEGVPPSPEEEQEATPDRKVAEESSSADLDASLGIALDEEI